MSGETQYISDTILLEKVFTVLSECNQSGMEKYAWDLASLLPSIGNEVSSLVGGQYSTPRTIIDLLAPGIFFGIHPLLGALMAVSESFGYDLTTIFNKIKSAILPDLEAGKPVSAEKINSAAQAAIPAVTETSESSEVNQADDLLYPLRAMMNSGKITKEAIWGSKAIERNRASGGWLNPLRGLLNLFTKRRRGNIIVGLLVWFIKTVLLSAGLLAVAGAVVPKKIPNVGTGITNTSEQVTSVVSKPASTGAGSYVYKTQPGDLWIEDLVGRQPYEMILQWALQSYPSLNQYTSIILNTPSFWNAVRQASSKWRPGQKDVSIQDPFKKRDDVVNVFIDDVFRAINDIKGENHE
jgi:hypothetical protein